MTTIRIVAATVMPTISQGKPFDGCGAPTCMGGACGICICGGCITGGCIIGGCIIGG